MAVEFEQKRPTGACERCVREKIDHARTSLFSCVMCKRAESCLVLMAIQFEGATLGRPFKSERLRHDLVRFGRKTLRRKVGEFFRKMLMIVLVLCPEEKC